MFAQAAASPEPTANSALPAQTASLEGTAVLQSSGQPCQRFISIFVERRGFQQQQKKTVNSIFQCTAGQYHLYARREGYAPGEYGQAMDPADPGS
jgi:hypothetical protein